MTNGRRGSTREVRWVGDRSWWLLFLTVQLLLYCGRFRVSDLRIGTFGIFAQDAEVAGQRAGCIDGLPVSHGVVESDVDVELILPFAADDRQGLDFREVDVVEREYGEDLREASLGVTERETSEALLVRAGSWNSGGAAHVGEDQEAGKVVFVGFDAALEDFEAV